MTSAQGNWINPVEGEQALITAAVSSSDGIFSVVLYYDNALVGNFESISMNDDGDLGDVSAGDGIYSALMPALTAGEFFKFYIQATENNTAKTQSYNPVGAEHDVYYFSIAPAYANQTDIVINEILANNTSDETDEQGEHEDWIELYNRGLSNVDLTGYHLTDNQWNLNKWEFPAGTILAPDDYLIIWADEDSAQGAMHSNFKLSINGETLSLINALGQIADEVVFGSQSSDMAYARRPNGTGNFVAQATTFAYNNDLVAVDEIQAVYNVSLYPNPADQNLQIVLDESMDRAVLTVRDLSGRVLSQEASNGRKFIQLGTADLAAGTYLITMQNEFISVTKRLIIKH
jgi:hypothetical protein